MSGLKVEVGDDRVAVITLDEGERRNALTLPLVDEIVETFDRLEASGDVGAFVITGAPPAFCAGADLGDLAAQAAPPAPTPARARRVCARSTRASSGWPGRRCPPWPPSTALPSGPA